MNETNTNALSERNEIERLVNTGFDFEVATTGFVERLFYGKKRRFTIREPRTGALDLIARELLEIEVDEDELALNPIAASMRIATKHAVPISRIIAVLVLNERCVKVTGFRNGMPYYSNLQTKKIDRWAQYFLWKLKPSDSLEIARIVKRIMNIGDFIKSTRLMSVSLPRTTKPKANLVEENT